RFLPRSALCRMRRKTACACHLMSRRCSMRCKMARWVEWINDPDDSDWLLPRGHKAYVVETMCRILYTLATGELSGKPQSVAWALETLPEPWRTTLERSQVWRNDQTVDLSISSVRPLDRRTRRRGVIIPRQVWGIASICSNDMPRMSIM